MVKDFDFLLERMKQNHPVLLLGAGFSYGATNGVNEPLPLGSKLADMIYTHFFVDGDTSSIDSSILDEIYNKKTDLKELCNYLRLLKKTDERNHLLRRTFRDCKPATDGFHAYLTKYPWEYIFTLNIDDLVENVYRGQQPISVWDLNNPNGNNRNSNVNLIKLHGSVDAPDKGYIFDNSEYRDFTVSSNCLLREFAHQALQHDLVLVGTEFQEDDLETILDIYETSGYSREPYYRFFVSPSISGKLKLQIQNSDNDVWIKGDTKTFLERLNRNIIVPGEGKAFLKEKGAVFLEEISRSTPSSFELYKGMETVYPDFFHDADIYPKELNQWKTEILSAKNHLLIAFYGDSYVGKSCFAKRLLVELFNEGFISLQMNRFDEKVSDLLISYLQSLPEHSKVAVYCENAAYLYKRLLQLKKNCPKTIDKLVFITEDTQENHHGKEYLLLDDPNSITHKINVTMDEEYACAVYDRLSRNRRLNKYLQFIPVRSNPFSPKSRKVIVDKILEENDIIDALYFSTEGIPFQKHYQRWLNRYSSDGERHLLEQLCFLFKLGIAEIPNLLVSRLGKKLNKDFRLKDFCIKYAEVISVSYGWTRLRRGRILNQLIDTADATLISDALYETAIYSVPNNERNHTELTPVFEKVIRVKRIRSSNLLSKDKILSLLKRLEADCNHISYYWVQYGIAAQINCEYEDASNHLLYAQSIRPQSYHVNHAFAKNEMEWGLFLLKDGIYEGEYKFFSGSNKMQEIAQGKQYSDGYRYSVHTYVGKWLEYTRITGTELPHEVYEICTRFLEPLLGRPLDNMLTDLIKAFIAYCDGNGKKEYSTPLKTVYGKREQYRVNRDVYDID